MSDETKRKMAERLQGERKEIVMEAAEAMMAEAKPSSAVREALMEEYDISHVQARNVIVAVRERWKTESAPDRHAYKTEQVGRLMSLYREARQARQFGNCIKIENLLAKMHGTLEATKVELSSQQRGAADEFSGRSAADVTYYMEHGHFPEEGGEPVKAEKAPDKGGSFPLH